MKHLNTYNDYLAEQIENVTEYSDYVAEHIENTQKWMTEYAHMIDSGIRLNNPMRTMKVVPSSDFVIESEKQNIDINYNKKNKTSNDFWKYKL